MKLTHLFNLLLALALLLAVASTSYTIEPRPDTSAAFSPQAESIAENNWQVECVDCPRRFGRMTDRSLHLDHVGRPHIAYGSDHLYYAWHDGTQWHYETVDPAPGMGLAASLALDEWNQPHISYHDSLNNALMYARRDGMTWQIETVDSKGHEGTGISLALDRTSRPHIGYLGDNDTLKYAWHNGITWQIETVDQVGSTDAFNASLALDGLGRPHISYYDGDEHDLKYAWRDGQVWQIETVDSAGLVGTDSSLALDVAGQPYISYFDWGNSDLKYARRDGTDWQIETVDSQGYVGAHTSLALDGLGRPHVSYYDWGNKDLKHAWSDGQVWRIETVNSGGDVGTYTSLALDGENRPHISYYDRDHDTLKLAQHTGTSWQVETVDGARDIGTYTSLALDGSDRPHISYCLHSSNSDTCEELKYARHDGTNWQTETVDDAGHVGAHNSLALDGTNQPHISYYDSADSDLKYARRDGTGWHVETVDSAENVGQYTSLALDGSDHPHISYYSGYPNHDLKYAWYDGVAWHIETVDHVGSVGAYTSLALDEEGRPHISYFDNTNDDLKYARHDGAAWHIETVTSEGHAGTNPSLALDKAGQPHISYFDGYPNCELKIAFLTPPTGTGSLGEASWQVKTVPASGGCSESYLGRSSLALDGFGRPHLTYCLYETDTYTCRDLQYVWCDGKGWHVETVPTDRASTVGRYTSMALDRSSRPHISYQGTTNGDLKYTWRIPTLLDLDKQVSPSDNLHNNDTLTYTLTLLGPGLDVYLWDPLPPHVYYVPGSLSGSLSLPPVYSPTLHAIIWQGTLPTDSVQVIGFQVTPGITGTVGSLSLALPIINTAWLTDTQSGASVSATTIVNGWRTYLPVAIRND